MHRLHLAGQEHLDAARAAFRVDDLDLEPVLLVEAARVGEMHRQDGEGRRRDAHAERDEILRPRRGARGEQESEQGARASRHRHDFLPASLLVL